MQNRAKRLPDRCRKRMEQQALKRTREWFSWSIGVPLRLVCFDLLPDDAAAFGNEEASDG